MGLSDEGSQRDLFQHPVPLEWLPDETVYSLVSRFHRLSGSRKPAVTSKRLFGHWRGGFPHAIPGDLNQLSRSFAGTIGTARAIAVDHTIVPFLLVAKSQFVRQRTYRAMLEGSTTTLKAKLGLLASGFGGELPLKACRSCAVEDIEDHRTAFWRTAHQLPGVWVCRKHDALLDICSSMRAGAGRYAWSLPHIKDLVPLRPGISVNAPLLADMAFIASIADWLLWLGKEQAEIDRHKLKIMIMERLDGLGLMAPGARMRARDIGYLFCNRFAAIRTIPEFASVAVTPSVAYSQLVSTMQSREGGRHPLRIVAVTSWLFDNVKQLKDAYTSAAPTFDLNAQESQSPPLVPVDGRRQRFGEMIAKGVSITAAAEELHLAVATAQAWAAALGHQVPKRPSIVAGPLRDKVIAALQGGDDKKLVSERFHISESTVDRVLRTELGLYCAWRGARDSKQLVFMRAQWKRLTEDEHLHVKYARESAPNVYAWLYRNDRGWLKACNQSISAQIVVRSLRVNWDRRDSELSTKIYRAALEVHEQQRRVRLGDLLLKVPGLKSKLACLTQLPLTMQAIDAALKGPKR